MALEINGISRFLFNYLTTDVDGVDENTGPYQGLRTLVGNNIYEVMIPEGGTYPAIVFQHISGRTINLGFGRKAFYSGTYKVEVIGQGAMFGSIEKIANRLDDKMCADLTQGQGYNPANGLYVMGIQQESAIETAEVVESERFNHLGGNYRIQAYYLANEAVLNNNVLP